MLYRYTVGGVWDTGVVNDICAYRAFIDAVVGRDLTYQMARHNHSTHTLHFPQYTGSCYRLACTALEF